MWKLLKLVINELIGHLWLFSYSYFISKKISIFKLTDSLYLQMGFLKSSVPDSKAKFVQGNGG